MKKLVPVASMGRMRRQEERGESRSGGDTGDDIRRIDGCARASNDDDVVGSGGQRTEDEGSGCVGQGAHEDTIDAGCILLFESYGDCASEGFACCAIDHDAVDGRRGGADFASVKYRLQAVLAIFLLHDGDAGVEVDVQILGLACTDVEASVGDLSGGDLDAVL